MPNTSPSELKIAYFMHINLAKTRYCKIHAIGTFKKAAVENIRIVNDYIALSEFDCKYSTYNHVKFISQCEVFYIQH